MNGIISVAVQLSSVCGGCGCVSGVCGVGGCVRVYVCQTITVGEFRRDFPSESTVSVTGNERLTFEFGIGSLALIPDLGLVPVTG